MALIRNLSLGIQVKHDGFQRSMNAAGATVQGFSNQTKSALHQLQTALEKDTVAAKEFGTNAQGILNGISAKAALATGAVAGIAGAKLGSVVPALAGVAVGAGLAGTKVKTLADKVSELPMAFVNAASKAVDMADIIEKEVFAEINQAILKTFDILERQSFINNKWIARLLAVKQGYISLAAKVQNFANACERAGQRAGAAMRQFAANSWTSIKAFVARSTSAIASFAKQTASKLASIGKSIAGAALKAGAVGLAGAGAAFTAFTIGAVKAGAEAEQTKIAFETLFGSAAKGAKALQDLTKFADVTPFDTREVIDAGKTLKAFGFDAHELIPTLTKIGDVSAGLGLPLERLTGIYGKARVAGTLMAEDINQFTEAGVPIIEELAKVMGVNAAEVKKLGSEGKITFGTLEKAFAAMTGPASQFGGLMDKQSQSLLGVWGTLSAKLYGMFEKIGTGIIKAFDLTAVMQSLTEFVAAFEPHLPVVIGFFESIKIAFTDMFGTFQSSDLTGWVDTIVTAFKYLSFTIRASVKGIQITWLAVYLGLLTTANDIIFLVTEFIPAGFKYLCDNISDICTDIYNIVTTVFKNLGTNIYKLIKNLPGLIKGTVKFDDLWTPLTEGYQRVRKEFEAPIRIQTTGEETLIEMINEKTNAIKKDYTDVFGVVPEAVKKIEVPLTERFSDMFSGIRDGIKTKIGEGLDIAKNVKDKAKGVLDIIGKPKEDKGQPASFSSSLYGSTDSIRKINSGSGVSASKEKEDKEKKVKQAVDTTNYHLTRAVTWLEKMANKTTAALDF